MQGGAQYIDWSNSFFEFDLVTTLENTANITVKSGKFADLANDPSEEDPCVPAFEWAPTVGGKRTGHGGSVLNLINRVVISSRSGVELQRIEEFNKLHALHTAIQKTQLWKDTVGVSIQESPINDDIADQALRLDNVYVYDAPTNLALGSYQTGWCSASTGSGTFKRHYSIPMECFMGLFDTKQLCPWTIASGLKIELFLIKPAQAITGCNFLSGYPIKNILGGGTIKMKMEKPQIRCDTVTLNDAAQKQLNMTSAQNGLEYVYTSCFTQKLIMPDSNAGRIEMQCSKAVSRALFASAVHYPTPKDLDQFNHIGTTSVFDYYQWRLGSQYFPHQPVTASSQSQTAQYHNVLYATDVLGKNLQSGFTLANFKSGIKPAVASFERSNLLRFSGVPINNSRTLSLSANLVPYFRTLPNQQKLHHWQMRDVGGETFIPTGELILFLDYVTLSKSFLNNIIVSV